MKIIDFECEECLNTPSTTFAMDGCVSPADLADKERSPTDFERRNMIQTSKPSNVLLPPYLPMASCLPTRPTHCTGCVSFWRLTAVPYEAWNHTYRHCSLVRISLTSTSASRRTALYSVVLRNMSRISFPFVSSLRHNHSRCYVSIWCVKLRLCPDHVVLECRGGSEL